MKKAFKLAGTFNIVIALIAFLKEATIVYPLILMILSIIYFTYCGKNIVYIYNRKTLIIIFALINLFINPISGIIMLIGQDKIIQEYKNSDKTEEKQQLNSEERKISLSLNLGVALISISGIILLTTSWNIMNNTIKMIILIAFALLFFVLSTLSEKKLKIEMLSKNYWLLSMLFIILTVIANGYFEILSKWFSFSGNGRYLYLAFTLITISLLSVITDNKYHKTIYKNISYLGIITSIASIMLYFKLDIDVILIIINIALLALNTIKNKQIENIKELSKYLTIGLSILSIISILASTSIVTNLLLTILTIVNLVIITISSVNIEAVSAAIIINIAIVSVLSNLSMQTNLNIEIISIIAMIIYSVLYLINIIKTEKLNQAFKKTMNILTNISMFILLIININNKMLLTIISAAFVLTSLINYYKNTIKNENYLLPVKITIFIISSISYLTEIIDINISYIMIIMYIIIFIIYKLLKNTKAKNISLCIYYIIFTIALLINHNQDMIPSIINLLFASTTFMIISEEKTNKKSIISYIVFLLTITFVFAYTNILNTTPIYKGTIILLIYLILTIIPTENEKLRKINYFSIILPLMIMISDVNIPSDIKKILTTSIGMYIMILLNILLIKNTKDRNIFTTIMSTILILRIIFIESWIIGLYIGIIALTLLIIGFMKKEYKGLFIEGIIITIINLLLQFRYILKNLPLWLYTLLAGLIIIGIVTYKIIKDSEKDNR